jgi:hypothetical protein
LLRVSRIARSTARSTVPVLGRVRSGAGRRRVEGRRRRTHRNLAGALAEWIISRSGGAKPAPTELGQRRHPVLGNAPGTYVHERPELAKPVGLRCAANGCRYGAWARPSMWCRAGALGSPAHQLAAAPTLCWWGAMPWCV